jgi:sirohydrochlorin ferrochelatase
MHEFARLRAQHSPVGSTSVAFLAMAQPRVQQTLLKLGQHGWRRVVVQPHLLFHGDLHDTLSSAVENCRNQWPKTEWIVTPYLGQELAPAAFVRNLLLDAIGDRIRAEMGR